MSWPKNELRPKSNRKHVAQKGLIKVVVNGDIIKTLGDIMIPKPRASIYASLGR
jgi:hypothetical protein